MPDPREGNEVKEGRARRQTRIIREQTEASQQLQGLSSLVAILGPTERGQLAHALVAEQALSWDEEFPNFTVQEAGPEATTCAAVGSSKYADVWGK